MKALPVVEDEARPLRFQLAGESINWTSVDVQLADGQRRTVQVGLTDGQPDTWCVREAKFSTTAATCYRLGSARKLVFESDLEATSYHAVFVYDEEVVSIRERTDSGALVAEGRPLPLADLGGLSVYVGRSGTSRELIYKDGLIPVRSLMQGRPRNR